MELSGLGKSGIFYAKPDKSWVIYLERYIVFEFRRGV